MKLKIMFAALAALACAPPAMAQVYSADQVTGQQGAVQGTAADGKRIELPVYVPVRADGSVIDPAGGGTGASANQVQGNTASGTTDVGNPVLVGGTANSGYPSSVTTGQRVRGWFNQNGAQMVASVTSNVPTDALNASNIGGFFTNAPNASVFPAVANLVFNGSTYDRQRGDTSGTYVVEVPSAASAAGITTTASAAVTGGQIVKASAGNLYGFNVVSGASAGYVLVFNSATVPADGAVTPARCLPLAANTGLDVNLRGQPTYFSAGITIVFSTTGCFSKTASATAFISGDAK